jgi:alpha-tubulin suppressor-like RCC1 family protein
MTRTDAGRIYSWGNNRQGQLGDGTEVNRVTPVLVDATALADTRIVFMDAGTAHSAALTGTCCAGQSRANSPTEDGRIFAWGRNSEGQLGDGTRFPMHASPVQVMTTPELVGKKFISVTAGAQFTLGLTGMRYMFNFGCLLPCYQTRMRYSDGDTTKRDSWALDTKRRRTSPHE